MYPNFDYKSLVFRHTYRDIKVVPMQMSFRITTVAAKKHTSSFLS